MSKYWGVRVNEAISYKDIMLTAETVEVFEGNLIFKNPVGLIVFCVANTDWLCFYVASCIDGLPVALEHWSPVERNADEY